MAETPIDIAYILGAGASCSAGFPLAGGMTDALRGFVSALKNRPDCRRLHEIGEDVLHRMTNGGYRTIDELAFELRGQDNGRITLCAKAIMTALLLDLERSADLRVYRRALRAMIDPTDLALPPEGKMRVSTRAICINYNYDRCLSAAMYMAIAEARSGRGAETELRVQRLLNSGVSTMSERIFPVDTTRFADLRMHGLVGTELDEHDEESPVRGPALDDFGRVTISDALLEAFDPRRDQLASTMIFFPWEKHLPERVRSLIDATDRAAVTFLSQVSEIRVVGYSMSEMNAARLDRILRAASSCKVVSVSDPSLEVVKRVDATFARVGLAPKLIHHSAWDP